MLVNVVVIGHAGAGEADELPAKHSSISAVDWIAKHAFDRVLTEESEENGRLNFLQSAVLVWGGEKFKTFQIFQSFAIDFARREFALIPELWWRIFERRLCVAETIAAIGACELAINVDCDACFMCAGTGIVGREDAGSGSGDD